MDKIIYNAIETPDGTILESFSTHDFKSYKDTITGKTYIVDGGLSYLRRSACPDCVELSLYNDEPHDIQRRVITWGTYGKLEDGDYHRVSIKDMTTEHIEEVLLNFSPIWVTKQCMKQELIFRGIDND